MQPHSKRNSNHSDAHAAAPFRYFATVATTPTTTATDVAVAPFASETRRCPSVTTRLGAYVSPQPFLSKTASLCFTAPEPWSPCRCAKCAATAKLALMEGHARPALACKSYNVWCSRAPCPHGWRPGALHRSSFGGFVQWATTAATFSWQTPGQRLRKVARETEGDTAVLLEKDTATRAAPAKERRPPPRRAGPCSGCCHGASAPQLIVGRPSTRSAGWGCVRSPRPFFTSSGFKCWTRTVFLRATAAAAATTVASPAWLKRSVCSLWGGKGRNKQKTIGWPPHNTCDE